MPRYLFCLLSSLFFVGCEGQLETDGEVQAEDLGDQDLSTGVDLSDMQVAQQMDMNVAPDPSDMSAMPTKDMHIPSKDMSPAPDLAPPQDMYMPPQDMYTPPINPDQFDLKKVKWLDPNISSWPESATLSSVTIQNANRNICLNYTTQDGKEWPIVNVFKNDVVGNAWVFIKHKGVWHGATWEWLRPGQKCKLTKSVDGSHIKKKPFHVIGKDQEGDDIFWTPNKGDVLYFMVSGLARNGIAANIKQRTKPVRVVWP